MNEFEGIEIRFGKCIEPMPQDLYLVNHYQWIEEKVDPLSLVGAKAQYNDVWYIIVSYDKDTHSFHAIPITDAPSLSQPKDYAPALGGSRKQNAE